MINLSYFFVDVDETFAPAKFPFIEYYEIVTKKYIYFQRKPGKDW